MIDCPFAVINADDFYGAGSFKALHEYLTNEMSEDDEVYDYCMAGYILGNTLSESGTVARGVCSQNEDGYLRSVTETYKIGRKEGKVTGEDVDGRERELDEKSLVSMNMWGLKPNIIKVLGEGFPKFLDSLKADDIKSEYLLPVVIDGLIQGGLAKVKVLPIEDKWYGVTYQEDRQYVADAIRRMVDDKVYGEKLFG